MKNRIGAIVAMGALLAFPALAAEYGKPEVLLPPSPFAGVHGLAVDTQGRLLAGSVVGNSIWTVDTKTGVSEKLIGGPKGQADDIAIGPNGEMVWTSYMQGVLRTRANDDAPIMDIASGLPGINSVNFDMKNGRLYGSQVFLGDALYEFDITGKTEPRKIAEKLGGFNGFEVGKDGMIYGPLWFKGQVAKVNPDTGEIKIVADGFETPAAVNFDSKGNLWVIDTKRGELVSVDVATGKKGEAIPLKSSIDNLAIDGKDHIYVSNMADHSITKVNGATGEKHMLVDGKAAVPSGLKISEDGKTLFFADIFAMRSIDTMTGKVTDYRRMQEGDLEYPFSVGLSNQYVLAASWFTGTVQVFNRADMSTKAMVHGFKAPTDAVELADGTLLVSEIATGSLVQASGPDWHEKKPVVTELQGPVQLIRADDMSVYVTIAAGQILKINTNDWSQQVIAKDLALPEGLALLPDGKLVVAEAAAGRLTEIDPATGKTRVLVEGLPIGLEPSPGTPPSYTPTGVAVDVNGVIYVSADRNNAIYRISPL